MTDRDAFGWPAFEAAERASRAREREQRALHVIHTGMCHRIPVAFRELAIAQAEWAIAAMATIAWLTTNEPAR